MHTHGIFPRDPSRLSGIAKVRHLGQASLIYREQKRIYAFVDSAASCVCLYFRIVSPWVSEFATLRASLLSGSRYLYLFLAKLKFYGSFRRVKEKIP